MDKEAVKDVPIKYFEEGPYLESLQPIHQNTLQRAKRKIGVICAQTCRAYQESSP